MFIKVNHYCLLLLVLFGIFSCSYTSDGQEVRKSLKDERALYDQVVLDVQRYRDESECFELGCQINMPDGYFEQDALSHFHYVGIHSKVPLVIKFQLIDTIYYSVLYAETPEAEEYIQNQPGVHESGYQIKPLDEQWFLMKLDWN